MSAIVATRADKDTALAELLKRIEGKRKLRTGATIPDVRRDIAWEAKVSPGTLENIGRRRSKGLKGLIRDRLAEFAVREIRQEIQRLEHDLWVALEISDCVDADAVCAAQTALEEAKSLLRTAKSERT